MEERSPKASATCPFLANLINAPLPSYDHTQRSGNGQGEEKRAFPFVLGPSASLDSMDEFSEVLDGRNALTRAPSSEW